MSSHHDASDFVDSDFQSTQHATYTPPPADMIAVPTTPLNRPPTREEIESMVSEKQIKLAELKRAQEELERERSSLEELRRKQAEFQTGREEMLQQLTRGIGLLEEAELVARRDAEQMARTLAEFREASAKVQAINEQTWSQEEFSLELTRALTTIENARMEWNSARLKFTILSGQPAAESETAAGKASSSLLGTNNIMEIAKIGLALTWPIVAIGTLILIVLLLRH